MPFLGFMCGRERKVFLLSGVLEPDQIVFSPQGWGPARNIIGFTGGDLLCQPEFYCLASEEIKKQR